MTTVKIFGFAPSTYVRTARLVCEEKEIAYELVPLDFQSPSHAALHPFLKMPSMQHADASLFETLAIVTYLNEEFPGPDLEAGSGPGRARMLQWISAANDYLYADVVGRFAKADEVDPKAVEQARLVLTPVDRALAQQPFLAGDELTLADLFVLPMLLYTEKAVGDAKWLSALPDLSRWLDGLRDRPSVHATEA